MENTHNNRGPFGLRYKCEAYLTDHTVNRVYHCDLDRGHLGSHSDSTQQQVWPLTTPYEGYFRGYDPRYKAKVTGEFPKDPGKPAQTPVLLTLEDLKTIAYYMAEEEDGDKTKIKIDEALKGML